jgi:branched-chain amino acid transport system substrate-binding protein
MMVTSGLRLLTICVGLLASVQAASAIDPIKIGIITAPSTPTPQAQQTRDGLEIATKMVNDAGGALGRPLELVFHDRQGPSDAADAALEKLIKQDKLSALVGAHQGSSALAEVEVAHKNKVPYIAETRLRAVGEKLYPEVFNIGISNEQIAVAIAQAMKSLGAKRVVAFTDNTDNGIELANRLAHQLNNSELGIQYAFETLDPAAKDFSAALQPHKANPPDVVVQMLRPPAAYAVLEQLQRQGIAPTAKTLIYDSAALIEDPAFWQNAKDAGPGMLGLGFNHPLMPVTDVGRNVGEAYKAKTGKEASGAVLQAADDVLMIAEAIKSGGSSEPEAIVKSLENLKWTGARGRITFSTDKDEYSYHQWPDVPFVTYQITAPNQSIAETTLVQEPGQPLDAARVQKSK